MTKFQSLWSFQVTNYFSANDDVYGSDLIRDGMKGSTLVSFMSYRKHEFTQQNWS